MSRFEATVTITHEIDDYDDSELELDDGQTVESLTRDELRVAREELVVATFARADPTSFIIEISELESSSGGETP